MNRRMRSWLIGSLTMACIVGAVGICANTQEVNETSLQSVEVDQRVDKGNYERVSVHDPSIIKADGVYYVFGSHIAVGKSTDLMNWTSISNEYTTPGNVIYDDLSNNLKESFAWAGENDADCLNGYAVWAPDIFWNADYKNADGSKGAYMLYYCTSSTYKRSCIGYAVSENVEGPYTYVDTIVYSGFTKEECYDTNSKINTQYLNTNLGELLKNDTLKEANEKWFNADGSYNTDYAPNAIDPNLFYDKEGKLWMSYGSWSGGIYVLEVDKETGVPIYPKEDGMTKDGNQIDRYFGTQIAGGHTISGEGPYIIYNKENDYYYLFMSYASLTADGGYNMRLFRSKNPDGPYVDAAGNNASLPGKVDNNAYGVKLIGNYEWSSSEVGYKAAGHNSAFIDEDEQMYLIYHTRFNGGTELHQVRVHQMVMNSEGWPVVIPYEYSGDTVEQAGYDLEEIIGKYEWINHRTDSGSDMIETKMITLNKDYTVSGAVEGTWTMTQGSSQMSLTVNGVTYYGVFEQTYNESSPREAVMTFSVVGSNNTCIWGSQLKATDDEMVEYDAKRIEGSIAKETKLHLSLPTSGNYGSTITWTSGNEKVIDSKGIVTRQKEDEVVTLSATIQYGKATLIKEIEVKVIGIGEEVKNLTKQAKYCFDFDHLGEEGIKSTGLKEGIAVLVGNTEIHESSEHEKVVHITNKAHAIKENYVALPQDTFEGITEGYTIGMWVKLDKSDANYWEHSALFEANAGGQDQYPVTRIGANLYGRINANGKWGDVTLLNGALEDDTWHYVAYSVSKDGIVVCLDGQEVGSIKTPLEKCFENNFLAQMTDVRVGSGNIWGDADLACAAFDRISIYDSPLSIAELIALYHQESKIK